MIKFDVFSPLNWAFASADSISPMKCFDAFPGYLPGPIFFLCPVSQLYLLKGTAAFFSMTSSSNFFALLRFLFLMKLEISTLCLNDTGNAIPTALAMCSLLYPLNVWPLIYFTDKLALDLVAPMPGALCATFFRVNA